MIVAVWLGSLVNGDTAVGAMTPEVVEVPQSHRDVRQRPGSYVQARGPQRKTHNRRHRRLTLTKEPEAGKLILKQ